MREKPRVGFALSPDAEFLRACADVMLHADVWEVLPEGLVQPTLTDGFHPNGLFRIVSELQQRHGRPIVAHGTGLSVAGGHPFDAPRLGRWLERAHALSGALGLAWYTDHWGITAPAGLNLTLPLPVPHARSTVAAARARLDALADAVGAPVGVENSVFYTSFGDPLDEAELLAEVLGDRHVMLLDVHNLWVDAANFGIDPERWLDAAPLDRVVEIHVSGGKECDRRWTPRTAHTLRLDSHDTDVPEPVWALLARALARCPNVRLVTLERLEGTVADDGFPRLVTELERIRDTVDHVDIGSEARPRVSRTQPALDLPSETELVLSDVWSSSDPEAGFRRLAADPDARPELRAIADRALVHADGIGVSRRLVARQRFERLVRGSASLDAWFERDPAGFAAAYAAYTEAVPPVAFLPADEVAAFVRFTGRDPNGA